MGTKDKLVLALKTLEALRSTLSLVVAMSENIGILSQMLDQLHDRIVELRVMLLVMSIYPDAFSARIEMGNDPSVGMFNYVLDDFEVYDNTGRPLPNDDDDDGTKLEEANDDPKNPYHGALYDMSARLGNRVKVSCYDLLQSYLDHREDYY